MKKKKLAALYERANMVQALSSNVAMSMDDQFRIAIKHGMPPFGDCVSIEICNEDGRGLWQVAQFSPARARLIAQWLIEKAEYAESMESAAMIDKPAEEQAARLYKKGRDIAAS